jgi:hypothetical protein
MSENVLYSPFRHFASIRLTADCKELSIFTSVCQHRRQETQTDNTQTNVQMHTESSLDVTELECRSRLQRLQFHIHRSILQ